MNPNSFRLVSLELLNHKLLENIKIDFFKKQDIINGPITTLIIGPNGTGKSEILRALIQIFRELEYEKNEKKFKSSYKYILNYLINGEHYEISKKEGYDKSIKKNGKEISISELILPSKILASTFILNDKFIFPKKTILKNQPHYEYLGLRTQSGAAGTKSYLKKLVENIIDSLNDPSFIENIKDMFDFLNLKREMTIYYHPKYRSRIFTKDLTLEKLDEFFLKWEKRLKYKPFSLTYYNKLKQEEKYHIVKFIKESLSRIKKDGRSYFYEYPINFNNIDINYKNQIVVDFEYIKNLMKLDILEYPNIEIKKNVKYNLEESSSGEHHFISTVVMILSRLENNSLILIDEPENSFHPNWQIKYVESLKNIFRKYTSCHFLIATHSHFMVSDLKQDTSSIVSLKMDGENKIIANILSGDTFCLSAEEILYKIFDLPTVRNYYIASEIGDILNLISEKDTNKKREIELRIEELKKIIPNLREVDPLKKVITTLIEKY